MDAKLAHELKVLGIFPENLFLAKEISLKAPQSLKKSSGIVPERLFSLKSMILRFSRRVRLGLMLPVRQFLDRESL
jgi:hypothetical protein